jgi:thermitase
MDAHGTLVASLIAAQRKEGEDGMWGLAPDCTVLAAAQGMPMHDLVRLQADFHARSPKGTMTDLQKEFLARADEIKAFTGRWLDYVFGTVADGIHYLADHGATVINLSIFLETSGLASKPELKARVADAFDYARKKDVLIVLGAGNNDRRVTDYPGDRDSVMVAGASTLDDRRWSIKVPHEGTEVAQGSCYGPRLSVVAPVEKLVVAAPHEPSFYSWNDTPMGKVRIPQEGPYTVVPWGATSSAAPQVAALAALVRSLRPNLRVPQVIHLIEQGADPIGEPGFHEETGFGRINFRKTLELAQTSPAVAQP